MQSAELYSHPLRVLDVEARLGAPPVLQTAALQLLLQPILLRVPVRNGGGDVVHFGRAAASPVPGNQHVIAEHQAALLSVVFSDLHAQEIHIAVLDLSTGGRSYRPLGPAAKTTISPSPIGVHNGLSAS